MAEEWIVRVGDREFGPADLEMLREWKQEGRILPHNPARLDDDEEWSTAGAIPGLFVPPPLPVSPFVESRPSVRPFSALLAETFRIYRLGFWQFFGLSLLVGIPGLALKLALGYIDFSHGIPTTGPGRIAAVCAVVALALFLTAWPIFVAGLQILSAEIREARPLRFRELLRRAIAIWPRIARLASVVYGSYALWSVMPLFAIASLAVAPASVVSFLLVLFISVLQVYMTARLFVNFLFWQQACAVAGKTGLDALLESKQLARSQPKAPRLQRPLYRGALLASLWILVIIAISAAAEFPFVLYQMRNITTVEQGSALMQTLVSSSAPDSVTTAIEILSSLIHAILRPLLGIAFVVLYFEAKANASDTPA